MNEKFVRQGNSHLSFWLQCNCSLEGQAKTNEPKNETRSKLGEGKKIKSFNSLQPLCVRLALASMTSVVKLGGILVIELPV